MTNGFNCGFQQPELTGLKDEGNETNLTSEIVQVVKGYGGRFLKQENGGWIEIDDEAARDKVSHSFRNLRQSMGASSTKSACAKKVSIERSTGQNRDSKKVRMTPSPRFD